MTERVGAFLVDDAASLSLTAPADTIGKIKTAVRQARIIKHLTDIENKKILLLKDHHSKLVDVLIKTEDDGVKFVNNMDEATLRNMFSLSVRGSDTQLMGKFRINLVKLNTRDVTLGEIKKFIEDVKTHLDIILNYLGEVDIKFGIYIIPVKDNKCLISFEAGEHLIPDEKTFLIFINLCKEVFNRLNFVHGAFRSQYLDDIPLNEEDFLKKLPNIVNFYSKPLVDKFGREKLLSAPARKVEELENGGIMLLICTEQLGCPDELDAVRLHLGYELRYV